MALANTTQTYGTITKTFHWLMALMILSLIGAGWYAEQLPYTNDAELARKAWLFSMHKTFGVMAFFVALARILWAFSQPKPGLLNANKKAESFAAELVHWLLYGAMVIVPLSGWISHAAAAGFAPIWWPFGQGLPLVPKSTTIEHAFSDLHFISGRILIVAVLLHMAGALKHHVIDRDSTLRRMLPGRITPVTLPAQAHSRTPVFAALAVWVAAVGFAMTQPAADAALPATESLAEVSSDWRVETGELQITVTQFGGEVVGTFADWTAAITFDETVTEEVMGTVDATISVPSLTLGSVTDQAMGADFFDAATFPTARFEADLKRASDGYVADGTLTIRDNSVPLAMPFALSINGDDAEMRGDLTLDRRDFGIGDNMADESSLAFAVKVKIVLTATRSSEETPAPTN